MKKIQISILSVAILSVLLVASSVSALDVGSNATASSTKAVAKVAALTARIQKAQTRAGQEIDRRVTILNDLTGKVVAMTRLASDQKTAISNSITQQVSVLTQLKTKIMADTDITTLKADIKSITDSYRIFMLVIPQINIIRTTDAMIETSQMLGALGTKLQTRISTVSSTNGVSALNTLMTDFAAKITDAQNQAQAATTVIAPLKPDQGDQATITANKQAIATAKADLKTARVDLKTARQDAGKIVMALKGMKTATATPATTTSAGNTSSTTSSQ